MLRVIFPLTSLAREESATDVKDTGGQRFMKYPTMHKMLLYIITKGLHRIVVMSYYLFKKFP